MTLLVDRRKDNYDDLLMLARDARASRARVNRWTTGLVIGAMAAMGVYVATVNQEVDKLRAAAEEAGEQRDIIQAEYARLMDDRNALKAQMDTFDPKPEMERWNGTPLPVDAPPTQFDDVGTVLHSPWKFRPGGESGLPISDLFPVLREQADKLCVVRSITNKFPEHTAANYILHTGHNPSGRPSVGAWCTYGLGSEADDLPRYVVLAGGLTPPGGI